MERRKDSYIVEKQDVKILLRVAKPFVKINFYLKNKNISQPAISKFITSDSYDNFISEKNVNIVADEIYNSCKLYCDLYEGKKFA